MPVDEGLPVGIRVVDPGRGRAGDHDGGIIDHPRSSGLQPDAQVAGRPVGLTLGLTTSLNPFALREGFAALAKLPPAEMLARLREPGTRRTILAEEASERLMAVLPPLSRQIATRWDRMYLLGEQPDYEPPPERSIAAMAEREGVTPAEYCYDYFTGGDGSRMVYFPVTNYVHGDLEVVRQMIEDPHTILGLSDGGAHCGVICDASLNTSMLSHWVRDRTRGPRMPLERTIQRMTGETADFYGFKDRGRLQPGKKADVNVIDFEGLTLHSPKMIFDLPAGGRRLVQTVDGYDMTICSGTPIFEKGQETGARPGKLVRSTG